MSLYLSVSLNRFIRPIVKIITPQSPLRQAVVYLEDVDIVVGKACRSD